MFLETCKLQPAIDFTSELHRLADAGVEVGWLCLYVDLNGTGQASPPTVFLGAVPRQQETLSPVSFHAVRTLSLSYLHAGHTVFFPLASRAVDPSARVLLYSVIPLTIAP